MANHPAHNGLVAGSSPAGPTNEISGWVIRLTAYVFSEAHRNRFPSFLLAARSVADIGDSGLQMVGMVVPIDLLQHLDAHT